jgi:ribosomal protein S18 acetylase RimI-like enzyme
MERYGIKRPQGSLLPRAPATATAARGYAVATFGFDLEFAGLDAFVTELFVRSPYRGTGDGRRLLREITETMRNGGAGAMHLAVWPNNRPARRLYESVGFARRSRLVLSQRLARGRGR